MKRLLLLLWCIVALTPPARAEIPFLDDGTLAVVRIDLDGLDFGVIKKTLAATVIGQSGDDFPPADMVALVNDFKKLQVRQLTFVFSLSELPQRPPFGIATLAAGADANEIARKLNAAHPGDANSRWQVVKDHLVIAAEPTLKRLAFMKAAERPELHKAMEALPPAAIQIATAVPAESRKLIEETVPRIPDELGGGSIKLLTRGIQWAGLAIELKPDMGLRCQIQASDNEAATQLRDKISKVLKIAAADKRILEFAPKLPDNVARLIPEQDGDRLRLRLDSILLGTLVAQPIEKARTAASRARSTNNLKQFALAFHNYEGVYGKLPAAAISTRDGKKLLSWRVSILPYIEQVNLYNQFHLDEPWDSEHNKKLIPKMPNIYAPLTDKKLADEFKTCYLLPVGKETMHPGLTGLRFPDITDGTSNTIMVLESSPEAAVIWTKPDDIEVDARDPYKGIGFPYGDGFLAAFGDGSVRFLNKKVKPKMLWMLFTRAGREVIPADPSDDPPTKPEKEEPGISESTQAGLPGGPRLLSTNNLKQLGLAFHNSASTNKGAFPAAAITDKDGKKLLSWRVAILPFIAQEKLYKEFHLDEPWDSEHNKKLIAKIPRIYAPVTDKKLADEFKTCYLLPVGKETAHPGTRGLGIASITDGLSNTILVVESTPEAAVVWTKPDDLEVDLKEPTKNLGTVHGDGYLCSFCDGSVRLIGKKITAADLKALFTASGGEVVGNIP